MGLFSSTYQKLLKEEKNLPKVVGKMSFDDYLNNIVTPRAELKEKVEDAYRKNKISREQHDELVGIIQKNGMPPTM